MDVVAVNNKFERQHVIKCMNRGVKGQIIIVIIVVIIKRKNNMSSSNSPSNYEN